MAYYHPISIQHFQLCDDKNYLGSRIGDHHFVDSLDEGQGRESDPVNNHNTIIVLVDID